MKQYDFISEGEIKESPGLMSFDLTKNSDMKDGDNFIMSENYLKKAIFDKVKAFCNEEKIAACVSLVAHGYIANQGFYGAIGSFITSKTIISSWATTEEVPENMIESIMNTKKCDEMEARDEIINSDDFFQRIYSELEDSIEGAFGDEHKHGFLEKIHESVNDELDILLSFEDFLEDLKNKGKCYHEIKEKYYGGLSAMFDKNPWPLLIKLWW